MQRLSGCQNTLVKSWIVMGCYELVMWSCFDCKRKRIVKPPQGSPLPTFGPAFFSLGAGKNEELSHRVKREEKHSRKQIQAFVGI